MTTVDFPSRRGMSSVQEESEPHRSLKPMRPETKMANATVGKKAGDGVGWPRRATESQIRNKG